MKKKTYWANRQQQFIEQLETDEERLFKSLNSFYNDQLAEIRQSVSSYYAKYGKDNVIEYAELFKKLDTDSKRLLIEDIDSFITKYPEYKHLAPIRKSIYKLNRLEGLEHSIYMQNLASGAMEEQEVSQHLKKHVKATYNGIGKEIKGSLFNQMDDDGAKKFINKKWLNNENFSNRIWSNKEKLTTSLVNEVRNGFIRGESYEDIAKILEKKFKDVAISDIKRLVRTEGTYYDNEAMMSAFEDGSEHTKYEYVAVMDSKTSHICQSLDGETFKIKDREPGKNFPPMHPNCRSTFLIVMDDEDKAENDELLDNSPVKQFKKRQNLPREIAPGLTAKESAKIRNDYRAMTRRKFEQGTPLGQLLFQKYVDGDYIETIFESGKVRYANGKIHLNILKDLTDPRGPGTAYFHEYGHLIDAKMRNISNDEKLIDYLYKDANNADNEYFRQIIKKNDKASSISDLLHGLTFGKISGKYRHDLAYWENISNLSSEFFAHFIESQFDEERKIIFESAFPISYNYVENMVRKRGGHYD